MAIAVEQSTQHGVAYSASRTVSFGAAPGATDLVLASLYLESNASVTLPSGFTLLGSYINGSSTKQSVLAYKYGDTGNSYQFTWTGDAVHYGSGLTFSGVDSTTPIDVVAGAWDEDNFTALIMAAVTTVTDGALHVMACYNSDGGDGAAITGYTRYIGGVGDSRETFYTKTISPAGSTGGNTVDMGTEFWCQGLSFALRPAGAGGFNPLVRLRRLGAMGRSGQSTGMIRRQPM